MSKLNNYIDEIGVKYGRLTVMEYLRFEKGLPIVLVKCDCGKTKEINLYTLRCGGTKSCGCLNRDVVVELKTKHGLSGHPLINVWGAIKQRCYYKKACNYKWYGALGVTVCDEWRNDFKSFYDWSIKNGWKIGLELDKDILGDGMIYSPATCKWVTHKVNNRAKNNLIRFIIDGKNKTLGEWCELYKMPYSLVHERVFARGWTITQALLVERQKGGGGITYLKKISNGEKSI